MNLDEIRERLEKATPGPWEAIYRGVEMHGWDLEGPPEPMSRGMFHRGEDAQFIAHARQDIEDLVAEVGELRDLVRRGREIQGNSAEVREQFYKWQEKAQAAIKGE